MSFYSPELPFLLYTNTQSSKIKIAKKALLECVLKLANRLCVMFSAMRINAPKNCRILKRNE